MKLYELATAIHNVNALVDRGDLAIDEVADTLESLEMAIKDKHKSISAWILNIRSDIQQLKIAEEQMVKRRKALEAKETRLDKFLLNNMQDNGIQKIECPQFKVSLVLNPEKVEVSNNVQLETLKEKYVKKKTTYSPDKKAMKKYLTEGGEIDGVQLVRTSRLKWQ
jgi:hypothetical protein